MDRVLITGSRDWTLWNVLEGAILRLVPDYASGQDVKLVHGGCPSGADEMADNLAGVLGFPVEVHPADWGRYGKRAGFLRNKEMVDAGASICLAFIKNNSRGATMCARLAEEAGIPVVYYREDTQ